MSSASELTLINIRRMMEGVVPPSMCTVDADGMPNVNYLSLAEYVDHEHVALSNQFFNRSRANVLATGHAQLALDDPYSGAGVILNLRYVRTETSGPVFERIRAKLDGVASHSGMDKVFVLRSADIYKVISLRQVPGRLELPAAQPRCDVAGNARILSERMAGCAELAELLDTTLNGLDELLLIPHVMLWLLDDQRQRLTLLASHGYSQSGTGAEMAIGDGLIGAALREGVPIRVGHMMNMQTYARAAKSKASELGLQTMLQQDIPLPGLAQPRSQLAVPLRSRGRVLGVLFAESLHDQYFGYDDEDALMILGGQLAMALTLMQAGEVIEQPLAPVSTPMAAPSGTPLRLKYYQHDGSVFIDEQYLIRGVAGAILWKLASEFNHSGRCEFTNRELRLARDLSLPEITDNLEVRLLMLQRRLQEQGAALQIEKTGRGRFRFQTQRSLLLEEVPR